MKDKKVICAISKKEIPLIEAVRGNMVHSPLVEDIKKFFPDFNEHSFISLAELNRIREEHLKKLLEEDRGEITRLEKEVLDSVVSHELMSEYPEDKGEPLSFGERLADRIAAFGGSWKFITLFACFLFAWIGINIFVLAVKPFDPYPFILLNLILSCLAAIQAPVIMMSQNRMEAKDRKRALNDYKVNLKAEIEIRHLHEKIDHLIMKQMEHLNEIQQIQIELLNEINRKTKK